MKNLWLCIFLYAALIINAESEFEGIGVISSSSDKREWSDIVNCDESIAVAMAEEQNTTDGRSQLSELDEITPIPEFDEAEEWYAQGEQSTTIAERRQAFNRALSLFLEIEKHGEISGALNLNLANTYFQLGEYGYAIFYYHKALREFPRITDIRENLQTARREAGLPLQIPEYSFLFAAFSFDEWVVLFLTLLFIMFILWSLHVWMPRSGLRLWGTLFSCCCAAVFSILLWQAYMTPATAVLLKSTCLYRGPGEYYEKVGEDVLIPGTTLQIIHVEEDKMWVLVRDESQHEGFVSSKLIAS